MEQLLLHPIPSSKLKSTWWVKNMMTEDRNQLYHPTSWCLPGGGSCHLLVVALTQLLLNYQLATLTAPPLDFFVRCFGHGLDL